MGRTLLCLDIGSGTQDVLLHDPDMTLENCPKFILPAPALRIGRHIKELRLDNRNIWLHGVNMGGGVSRFIQAHLDAGLQVAALPEAALTIGDDLERVERMGVTLTDACPDGFAPVELTDFDRPWWERFLAAAELPWPDRIAACAQDHGFHPGRSNRMGRFTLWEQFLGAGMGRPENLVYETTPAPMTRLAALQQSMGGGAVCDTGSAAVLGALFVPEIEALSRERGLTLVNVGNSHTIAFLLFAGRIHGVYEQHTGLLDSQKLWSDLERFRQGTLSCEEVFDDRGHGCLTLPAPPGSEGFAPTYVLGPRRTMLEGYPVEYPAPGGDMMLAGCFGLIKGMEMRGLL